MKLDIEEIKTINLKKNDTLLIKLGPNAEKKATEDFRQAIQKFFKSNKVIVVCGDMEFSKIEEIDD